MFTSTHGTYVPTKFWKSRKIYFSHNFYKSYSKNVPENYKILQKVPEMFHFIFFLTIFKCSWKLCLKKASETLRIISYKHF